MALTLFFHQACHFEFQTVPSASPLLKKYFIKVPYETSSCCPEFLYTYVVTLTVEISNQN